MVAAESVPVAETELGPVGGVDFVLGAAREPEHVVFVGLGRQAGPEPVCRLGLEAVGVLWW